MRWRSSRGTPPSPGTSSSAPPPGWRRRWRRGGSIAGTASRSSCPTAWRWPSRSTASSARARPSPRSTRRLRRRTLERILADLGAGTVLCDAESAEAVRGASAPGVEVLDDVGALAASEPIAERTMVGPDLAAVIYTSGSTGEPKGVTLTHGNMTFVADSINEYLEMTGDDRILCVLPLSFGYGLYQLLTCVRIGGDAGPRARPRRPRPHRRAARARSASPASPRSRPSSRCCSRSAAWPSAGSSTCASSPTRAQASPRRSSRRSARRCRTRAST